MFDAQEQTSLHHWICVLVFWTMLLLTFFEGSHLVDWKCSGFINVFCDSKLNYFIYLE